MAFLIVGGLSALIDVCLMQLFISSGCDYLIATTVGFVIGLLVNFALHSSVTFQSKPTARSFARYLCLVGLNYLFTLGSVSLSMQLLGDAVIGKLLSLPLIAVNGYLVGKYWIFRRSI